MIAVALMPPGVLLEPGTSPYGDGDNTVALGIEGQSAIAAPGGWRQRYLSNLGPVGKPLALSDLMQYRRTPAVTG